MMVSIQSFFFCPNFNSLVYKKGLQIPQKCGSALVLKSLSCFVFESQSLLPGLIFGDTRLELVGESHSLTVSQCSRQNQVSQPTTGADSRCRAAGQLLKLSPTSPSSHCQTLPTNSKCGFATFYMRGGSSPWVGVVTPCYYANCCIAPLLSFPHIAMHSEHYTT